MKSLRITFCILACLCVAATVPIAVFFGWYCLACVAGAGIFGMLMVVCKRSSDPKPLPHADFMNSEEKNAEINELRTNRKDEE